MSDRADAHKIFDSAFNSAISEHPYDIVPSLSRDMLIALIEKQKDDIEKLRAALKPFADVAENDICDSLTDADIFRPITPEYSRATVLCVGDLRAAAAALKETGDE